jgi:hypothetical protein
MSKLHPNPNAFIVILNDFMQSYFGKWPDLIPAVIMAYEAS